jgi:hypothetical protein
LLLFVCAGAAQLPRIGDINFYGLRKLTPNEVLAAARVGAGDTVPGSRVLLEDRITELPDVMEAQVQSVCCDGDRTTLFIGVRERGEPEIEFHPTPAAKDTLPDDLIARYRKYSGELLRAGLNGNASGADPAMRRDREAFRVFAASHTLKLRTVLRGAADEEQRAAAATVIAWSAGKKSAVDDLEFALLDPDETVRTNVLRALASIAEEGQRQPALAIRIAPAGLVDLLNSVALSDRVEATKTLLALTDKTNAAAIDLLRERALDSLAEMARWPTRSYALPPFRLLGRIAGLPDAQVNESWEKGDRDTVIQQALGTGSKKPGLQ